MWQAGSRLGAPPRSGFALLAGRSLFEPVHAASKTIGGDPWRQALIAALVDAERLRVVVAGYEEEGERWAALIAKYRREMDRAEARAQAKEEFLDEHEMRSGKRNGRSVH